MANLETDRDAEARERRDDLNYRDRDAQPRYDDTDARERDYADRDRDRDRDFDRDRDLNRDRDVERTRNVPRDRDVDRDYGRETRRSRVMAMRATETRNAFLTTEFWLALITAAAVIAAGYWHEGKLLVSQGWALGCGVIALYVLSRGIAKAGSHAKIRDWE